MSPERRAIIRVNKIHYAAWLADLATVYHPVTHYFKKRRPRKASAGSDRPA